MEDRIQELEHELLKTQNRRNSEKEKLKEVTLELGALKSPITRETGKEDHEQERSHDSHQEGWESAEALPTIEMTVSTTPDAAGAGDTQQ